MANPRFMTLLEVSTFDISRNIYSKHDNTNDEQSLLVKRWSSSPYPALSRLLVQIAIFQDIFITGPH